MFNSLNARLKVDPNTYSNLHAINQNRFPKIQFGHATLANLLKQPERIKPAKLTKLIN